MQFTLRDPRIRTLGSQCLTVLAISIALAMTGPYGTYGDLGPVARYAYWIGLTFMGYVSILICAHVVAGTLDGKAGYLLVALGSAIPTTLAVAWVESLVRLNHPVALRTMPRVFISVVAIQGIVMLVLTRFRMDAGVLFPGRQGQAPVPAVDAPRETPVDVAAPGTLLARLSAELGTDIVALEAQDHYLRVITAKGATLVLMRMGDAIRELPADLGMQVHRSWWVAYCAVHHIQRSGGSTTLVVGDGVEVPVSRTYVAAVRGAAWPNLTRTAS